MEFLLNKIKMNRKMKLKNNNNNNENNYNYINFVKCQMPIHHIYWFISCNHHVGKCNSLMDDDDTTNYIFNIDNIDATFSTLFDYDDNMC